MFVSFSVFFSHTQLGPFIESFELDESKCIAAITLFISCRKVVWVAMFVDDAIKLAHVLL